MPKNLGKYDNDLSIPRKKDIDDLANIVDDKVAKTGDTMTGTLTVGSASLQTNGYITGSWLKTTADVALSTKPSKIAVINDGWIYSRTPAQIKDDIGLSDVDNVKQYSASNPPPYPVDSVNSKTGAVELTASDVGAIKRTGDSVGGTFEFGDTFGGATIITDSTPSGIHMYEFETDAYVSVMVPSPDSENELGFFGGGQMSGGIMTVGSEAVRLVNIGKPVKNTDAANKAYVDENSGVPIISLTSTDGRSFKGTVDDIGAIAKKGNVIAVEVGYTATSDNIILNLNNATVHEITRIGINGKFLDGISGIFVKGAVVLLQCAALSSNLRQGIWHIVGFNSKDGVQILTQSAQPTAQGIGDFWFQVN